jgi:hypothetical protein
MGTGSLGDDPTPGATNVALWRRLRNEARALALEATDAEVREALMRIAAEYNLLAQQAEEFSSGPTNDGQTDPTAK